MLSIKIHNSYRDVVAVADSNLIGKQFEEDNKQLDIKESFYKGNEVSEEQVIKIIQNLAKEDATLNFVGEKAIKAALQAGIISQEGIKKIQDIPYALILL
jgi:hypothetical protein